MEREELLEQAEQHYQQQKQKQKEAVAELGQAEGLGETDFVEFGGKEIEVKSWIPGEVTTEFADLTEAQENQNQAKILRNIEDVAGVCANLCVSEPYSNDYFWAEYYDQWGPEGLIRAFETIAQPAMDGTENRMDVDNLEQKKEAMGNSQRRGKDWQRR